MSAPSPALGRLDLVEAFRALPPRQARLLTLRLLEGRPLEACAQHLGSSERACAVHVLRALGALHHALDRGRAIPRHSDAEEQTLADVLERRLSAGQTQASAVGPASAPTEVRADGRADGRAELRALQSLAEGLRQQGPALQQALLDAERADVDSPAHRRAEALRVGAIVALIALALWFGLR